MPARRRAPRYRIWDAPSERQRRTGPSPHCPLQLALRTNTGAAGRPSPDLSLQVTPSLLRTCAPSSPSPFLALRTSCHGPVSLVCSGCRDLRPASLPSTRHWGESETPPQEPSAVGGLRTRPLTCPPSLVGRAVVEKPCAGVSAGHALQVMCPGHGTYLGLTVHRKLFDFPTNISKPLFVSFLI